MDNAMRNGYLSIMSECPAERFRRQFSGPITDVLKQMPALLQHMDGDGHGAAVPVVNTLYGLLRNAQNIGIYNQLAGTYFRLEILDIVSLVDCVRAAAAKVCNVHIGGSSCSGPVLVEGSTAMLLHAILGLVRNAFCFSQDKNGIRISVDEENSRAIVTIFDHGEGIKPAYRIQAFDPFFSTDSGASVPLGPAPGLGLDLAILDRLLQHLSGRSFVGSGDSGGGRIGFSLPVLHDCDDKESIKAFDAKEILNDRFSPLYLQLSGFCTYPM